MATDAGTTIGVHNWGLTDWFLVDNLTIDASGQMLGWWGFFPQQLLQIDKTTGIATPVGGPFGNWIIEWNGLDFAPYGTLWGINGDPDFGRLDELATVDPVTGVYTNVGHIGVMARHGDINPASTGLYYGIGGDRHGHDRKMLIVDLAAATVVAELENEFNNINVLAFLGGPGPMEVNDPPVVTSVTVPGAPIAITSPVSVSGAFTDTGGASDEPFTCTVDHADGSGPLAGTIVGETCQGPAHIFTAAGIYQVTVAVTDAGGLTGSLTAESFLVIYDPSEGFVTGRGWINSPAGAYQLDPSLTGKAKFGFVAKYKKGHSVPDGKTKFKFEEKVGGLKFKSSSYEFLVINQNDNNAQFKGSGEINKGLAPGGQPFRFMLWARDDTPDTFRIKIWYDGAGGEVVVYDNGFGQPLGGGKIQIKRKRR